MTEMTYRECAGSDGKCYECGKHCMTCGCWLKGISDPFGLLSHPEHSKQEDFYQKLAKEYLDGKEYWETDPSERIAIECFATFLDKRCSALNTETNEI